MAISFNDIPNTIRVPLAYIEFDNSGALTARRPFPTSCWSSASRTRTRRLPR